jgi:ankyrin repeat protein
LPLQSGAAVFEESDPSIEKALELAVESGNADLARYFLEACADPNANKNWVCVLLIAKAVGLTSPLCNGTLLQ